MEDPTQFPDPDCDQISVSARSLITLSFRGGEQKLK